MFLPLAGTSVRIFVELRLDRGNNLVLIDGKRWISNVGFI